MISGGSYSDIFAWARLGLAKLTDKKVVDGEPCSVWTLDQLEEMGLYFSACVAADGVPREMNQTRTRGTWSGSTYMTFTDVKTVPPNDVVFKPTYGCAKNYPTPPCEDKQVAPLDLYRIWGLPEPLDLQNRNTGDVLGDLSFVCTQGYSEAYRSKLITHWRVNVSHDFGQYSLCNYDAKVGRNMCIGPPEQLRRVGRRGGQLQGQGALLGQCTDNDDVGSQYSFPGEAMCAPGANPGVSGGCAWGGAAAVRTVDASCIMEDRGLLDACKHEVGHAPFLAAARIWEAAFASDDPSQGGCPEAPVSRSSSAIVV